MRQIDIIKNRVTNKLSNWSAGGYEPIKLKYEYKQSNVKYTKLSKEDMEKYIDELKDKSIKYVGGIYE